MKGGKGKAGGGWGDKLVPKAAQAGHPGKILKIPRDQWPLFFKGHGRNPKVVGSDQFSGGTQIPNYRGVDIRYGAGDR